MKEKGEIQRPLVRLLLDQSPMAALLLLLVGMQSRADINISGEFLRTRRNEGKTEPTPDRQRVVSLRFNVIYLHFLLFLLRSVDVFYRHVNVKWSSRE